MASGRSPLITNLSQVKTLPKWSFQGRSGRQHADPVPGPGAYGHITSDKDKYTKSPNFVFGTSGRDGPRGASQPGPGQYTPDDPNRVSARYGFGTSSRGGIGSKSSGPGPGSYETRANMDGGPKYTAAPRRAQSAGANAPGPGAYQATNSVKSTLETSPKWGFGTSQRQGLSSVNRTPGPGQYEAATKIGDAPKYSMKPRRTAGGNAQTPGPGAHGGQYTQFGY
mmetsp:Transcript_58499/g.128259  ORF Transcript_58499/g.128259 Transcript_58499/m.128259 type:complete len:224 (+) Transcript_58499:115-786(+)|eukprot:CAMPEP_0204274190 /NCGR_PEP_ID=MMETSP0468-20130131/25046_1 /ASSEMBLY_ACC=CAM_ASM_000383 /TAXON_ID=2969 /ORGANISM="Oxyrrhis marina" /LENGTH=223 /DNA_ID=CAMNT_0051250365 /DNA_START=99 /DNA_END=770 /DNA_ORIENTATION=-